MELTVTLHRDELTRAIHDVLPLRLLLGALDGNDDPAWVQVDGVETSSFVPLHGLRLTCAARVHYPLPVLPDDFTVTHTSLEMVPAIIAGPNGDVLAFTLSIADFDIKYMPAFVDRTIANKINEALREYATSIAWDFSKTLGHLVQLPRRLQLARTLRLSAPRGQVEVTADAIIFNLRFEATFQHDGDEDPTALAAETDPEATDAATNVEADAELTADAESEAETDPAVEDAAAAAAEAQLEAEDAAAAAAEAPAPSREGEAKVAPGPQFEGQLGTYPTM